MGRTYVGERSEGAWLEAITLFQSVRDADHAAAAVSYTHLTLPTIYSV